MPEMTSAIPRFSWFLDTARPLLAASRRNGRSSTLDLSTASALLEQLREPVSRARSRGCFANPWTMAGIGTYEVRNCAVLSALWDHKVNGDLARYFLGNFLESLDPHHKRVPSVEELGKGYTVRTEHCPLGLASERVDITVETRKHVVCIEAKVHAPEGHRQIERYIAAADQWAQRADKTPVVIFLATWRKHHPGIFPATWGDVAYAARKAITTKESTPNHGSWLLAAFAQHVSTFEDR